MIISQKDSVCNKPFGAIPQKRERNKLNYNRSSAFRVDVRRLYFIGRWSMKLQVLALYAQQMIRSILDCIALTMLHCMLLGKVVGPSELILALGGNSFLSLLCI